MALLEVKNLTKNFGGLTAVGDVSMELNEGELVGLIGPNGAGKSTLIKALIGIIPHSGKILFNKQPIRQQLNRISYVAQKADIDFNFPITVKECISLGLYPKTKFFKRLSKSDWSKVTDALTLLGLTDLSHRQISQLSGGQFQRVLIARCLVQEADIILLDEPFVGIDSVSEDIIMNTLRELRDKGKLILIVHHDLSKVPHYFDQVILLNRKLIASGPTNLIFNEDNLRKTYGNSLFYKGDVNDF